MSKEEKIRNDLVLELRKKGLSFAEILKELQAKGYKTLKTPATVKSLHHRLKKAKAATIAQGIEKFEGRAPEKRPEPRKDKESEQLTFFEALFAGCKGFVEIRTITPRKEIRQYFYKTGELKRVVADLSKATAFKQRNVYFGVCARVGKVGNEQAVKQIRTLWVDLDAGNLDSLKAFELKPSITVSSGNGYHLYWLLDKIYPVKDEKRLYEFKGYMKGLAIKLKGDTKTFDLSRVLRVPNTLNLKDSKNLKKVKLLEWNPTRRYDLSEFDKYKVKVEPVKIDKIQLEALKFIPDRFKSDLASDEFFKMCYQGVRQLKDSSRSGKDMALTHYLLIYGYTDNEIGAILTSAPYNKGKEITLKYLQTTIGKARASHKFKLKTGYQALYDEIIEPEAPIGGGFVVPDRFTIVAATDGEGKTCFLTQLSYCAILGIPLLGIWNIPKPVNVLYCCGENSIGDIQAKLRKQLAEVKKLTEKDVDQAMKDRLRIVEPINVNFCIDERPNQKGNRLMNLYKYLYQSKPSIVIFDPLADFVGTYESLDKDTMARQVAQNLNAVARKFKCFVVLTSHFKKGQKVMPENVFDMIHGSKYWTNSASTQIGLLRAGETQGINLKKLYIKAKTQPEQGKPIPILFDRETLWFREHKGYDEIGAKAKLKPEDMADFLQRVCEGETVTSIFKEVAMEKLNIGIRQVEQLLKVAIERGLIERDRKHKTLIRIPKVVTLQKELFKESKEKTRERERERRVNAKGEHKDKNTRLQKRKGGA